MTKKYVYTNKERKAEREIDRFLQRVGHASTGTVLDELRALGRH